MTALYEYDDLGVRMRVPYLGFSDDMRGRWWGQGIAFMDDLDRTKYSYSPPTELDYFDNKGSVGLIGCRSGASSQTFSNAAPTAGVGIIHASHAIEGARSARNYVKLNGLRSEIDGLSYWLGFSALKSFVKLSQDGSGHSITTTATSVDDIALGRALNLKAVARATSSGQQTPEVMFRSRVFLETFAKAPAEWKNHLALHSGLRDLLRVASWKPISFQSHHAASTKENFTVKNVERRAWREVRTATTNISEALERKRQVSLHLRRHRSCRCRKVA